MMTWGAPHGTRYVRHARGWCAYGARFSGGPRGKLPCASGRHARVRRRPVRVPRTYGTAAARVNVNTTEDVVEYGLVVRVGVEGRRGEGHQAREHLVRVRVGVRVRVRVGVGVRVRVWSRVGRVGVRTAECGPSTHASTGDSAPPSIDCPPNARSCGDASWW